MFCALLFYVTVVSLLLLGKIKIFIFYCNYTTIELLPFVQHHSSAAVLTYVIKGNGELG